MRNDGDRRQKDRVAAQGRLAICKTPTGENMYSVRDLSAGGMRLSRGPQVPVGTDVDVAILDGPVKPLRLVGKVVHQGHQGFGVAFDQNPDTRRVERLHDLLHDERRRNLLPPY
jgi:hypothetical protein